MTSTSSDQPLVSSTEELLDAAVSALGGVRRDGQMAMANAVTTALEKERHLAVQAGTGTGKSLAYLVPSIRHAHATDSTVVVSTATLALQRQLVDRDLPRLADSLEPEMERRPSFAIMKGRSNYLCLNKIARAQSEPEESLLDEADVSWVGKQVSRVHEWANDTETGDRDDIAGMAGTTIESASRAMTRLRKRGLIDAGREWVAISDVDGLRAVAEGC